MSDFFNNIKKSVKEAAEITKDSFVTAKDVIVEKSQEAGEYAKISVEKSTLRNELDKCYKELGKYFYEQGNLSGDAYEIGDKISQKLKRLEEIEQMQKGNKA